MLIELKWLDQNKSRAHRTEIFRSKIPFLTPEEATLIDTVNSGITTYLDVDVEQNVTYYYRFRLITESYRSPISEMFTFDARPYTGPGNSKLQFGDEHFGYYGVYPEEPNMVPTLNYVRKLLGLSDVESTFDCYPHKFAVGGSVRGTFGFPVALGSELNLTNPNIQTLIAGDPIKFTMGLHEWALIFPSAAHSANTTHEIEHFPGELRSMLGVITELYSPVEDAITGNTTGYRLVPGDGQVEFYTPLATRYPDQPVQWIATSDWDQTTSTVINWTPKNAVAPAHSAELHTEDVDYSVTSNWDKTLIWPVLVYTSLTGPVT